jgi:protein SCO1/2
MYERRARKTLLLVLALMMTGAPCLWAGSEAPGVWNGVGIEQHLGGFVPLNAGFTLEDGSTATLGELLRVPTVLALVYYKCPNACDFLLTGIAGVLAAVEAQPGKEFQVLTLSIDERETTVDALKAKRIGLESIQEPFPPEDWRFLTGREENIRAVAEAVGFHYVRQGDDFDHPLGLVILSPKGKIVRYMTGTDFLPVGLKMSLMEASTGTVGPTIAKVLRFCLSYDPQNHRYVFNALKVTGIVTLALAAGFVLYLVLSGRRRRAARRV